MTTDATLIRSFVKKHQEDINKVYKSLDSIEPELMEKLRQEAMRHFRCCMIGPGEAIPEKVFSQWVLETLKTFKPTENSSELTTKEQEEQFVREIVDINCLLTISSSLTKQELIEKTSKVQEFEQALTGALGSLIFLLLYCGVAAVIVRAAYSETPYVGFKSIIAVGGAICTTIGTTMLALTHGKQANPDKALLWGAGALAIPPILGIVNGMQGLATAFRIYGDAKNAKMSKSKQKEVNDSLKKLNEAFIHEVVSSCHKTNAPLFAAEITRPRLR